MHTLWEIARWTAYIGIQPYKKPHTMLTPKSLAVFPWEAEDEVQIFTDEEEDYFARKWGKRFDGEKFVN